MIELTDLINGYTYKPDNSLWLSKDNEPGLIQRNFHFHKRDIEQDLPGIWRYKKAFALPDACSMVGFGEGMSPIAELEIYGHSIRVKQEYLFPTGSYKDRGAALMLSAAKTFGISEILEDSSGNAGCAVSAYAAAAGIRCSIYVPEKASEAKIRQMELYGAQVHKIAGNRQDAAAAALQQAGSTWFASHVYNPWFYEGTKTFAYEIWEQMGTQMPEEILFPVGNGTLILGSYIGFRELKASGLINKIPALSLVQASNCAPLCGSETFEATVAEGIAVQKPARHKQILQVLSETGGRAIHAAEDDIIQTRKDAASKGFYIEYTSATVLAGLKQMEPKPGILVPLTGHGLKNN